jgi:hypothetical protein
MSQTKAQLIDGKSAEIEFTGGSASAPAISFTGDPNTGIYSPGADQVAVATNGTGRLFVDASGNVGLKVAAPSFVAGYTGLQADGGGNGSVIKLTNSTTGSTSADGFDLILQQGGSDAYVWQRESAPLIFGTAATERLRITSAGLVGIGTSSPSVSLHVVGGGMFASSTTGGSIVQARNSDFSSLGYFGVEGSTGGVTLTGTLANSTFISSGASGTPLQFGTGGVIRSTLTSTGLGIGTSSPSSTLHVAGPVTINNGDGINELTFAGTEFTNIYSDTTSGFQIGSTGAGYLALLTGNSERLRITSAGLVGIGTTAPDVNLVVEAATGDATLRVHAAENNSGSDPILILESSNDFAESTIEFKDSSGTGGAIRYNHGDNALRFQTNGTSERARIDSSGRLLVGTSTNNASYKLQIVHTDATGVLLGCFNGGTNYLSTLSSNGSEASKTVVSSGHELFTINATGYDGSANRTAATISAQVDGTPGAGDMPGRLVFSTTADGASSPTERMRINASGQTLIGKTSDTLSTPGWAIDGGSFIGRGQLTCGTTGAPILRLNHTGASGTEYVVESWKNGTPVGSITVTASATSYNTSSDYRLKKTLPC